MCDYDKESEKQVVEDVKSKKKNQVSKKKKRENSYGSVSSGSRIRMNGRQCDGDQ